MKTVDEKVAIYRAFLYGSRIEFTIIGHDYWQDAAVIPSFNWDEYDYRVKQDPQKQKVAYAFVSPGGYLEWNISGHSSVGCERATEFDIVSNEQNK